MGAEGKVIVLCGTTNYGQGHETTLAQIAAAQLQVPFESVRVVESDTTVVRRGDGSVGSRSMQLGGSAVHNAAGAVRSKAMRIAAHLLEVSHEDLELREGRFQVVGVPGSGVTWLDVAGAAYDPGKLPEDIEPGLKEDLDFLQDDATFPFGAPTAAGSSTRSWPRARSTAGSPRASPRPFSRRSSSTPTATP